MTPPFPVPYSAGGGDAATDVSSYASVGATLFEGLEEPLESLKALAGPAWQSLETSLQHVPLPARALSALGRAPPHVFDEIAASADSLALAARAVASAAGSGALWRAVGRDAGLLHGRTPALRALYDAVDEVGEHSDVSASGPVGQSLRTLHRAWSIDLLVEALRAPDEVERWARGWSSLADVLVSAAMSAVERKDDIVALGLTLVAMGKWGSRELNVSSDIDFVFVHRNGVDVSEVSPSIKTLVALLDGVTPYGQPYRVDLRLRPFGSQGALSYTVSQLSDYFDRAARDWERSAWLKARCVCGSVSVASGLLRRLEPFRSPRTLDERDVSALAARKQKMIVAAAQKMGAGIDLKHGRGGIRYIEFFVQAFQLVMAGRDPALRGASTPEMLRSLAERGQIPLIVAELLEGAWAALRSLEHLLQCDEEQQTHRFPISGDALRDLADRAGRPDADAWVAELRATMDDVAELTAPLFAGVVSAPTADWAAVANTPDAADALRTLGFERPTRAKDLLKQLYDGARPVLGERSKDATAAAAAVLLDAAKDAPIPDRALEHAVLALVQRDSRRALRPALKQRPAGAHVLASLWSFAPQLSRTLQRHPRLYTELLSTPPADATDPNRIAALPASARRRAEPRGSQLPIEAELEALGRVRLQTEAAVTMARLAGVLDIRGVTNALSALAEAIVREAIALVFDHGRNTLDRERFGVVAFGKLGARELGVGGDLDLVFVVDGEPAEVAQYARVAQRLVTTFTTSGAFGRLYDVDLRLRPDGSQGAIVTTLQGFDAYYARRARPYEKLALGRARVVYGGEHVSAALHACIVARATDADSTEVLRDVRRLRTRRLRDVSRDDFKNRAGGLLDLELALWSLQLAVESSKREPCLLDARGVLSAWESQVDGWLEALAVYRETEMWIRLAEGEGATAWPQDPLLCRAIEERVRRGREGTFDEIWRRAGAVTHNALAAAALVEV
ncbi:MAG: glutamate-ammonia-ligase adenylyltransferase [Bradymonadia bacterium]|jgi:glutamate-ammonia-ligase adenylyltransferase